jgi:hypothetical protein
MKKMNACVHSLKAIYLLSTGVVFADESHLVK